MSLLVRKAKPAAGQLGAQVEVVVDLAVEDDRVAAVLRGDRLVAARDVDDGKPAHAEAEIPVDEIAAVVGPAMHDAVALRDDRLARDRAPASTVPTGDAAHASALPRRLPGRHRKPRSAYARPKRADFLLERFDSLDVAQDDADPVRIELEIAAQARGLLRDRQ